MYSNWNEKEPHIYSLYWFSVQDLIVYLHALRRFIIHTPAKYSETHAPKLLGNLVPAAANLRFPNASYLCEGVGGWNIKLDLLELSVNVMINKNRIVREYPEFNTPGQVEIYALTQINELLQLVQKDDLTTEDSVIIQQEGFEQYYGLVWSAGDGGDDGNGAAGGSGTVIPTTDTEEEG